MTPLTVKSLRRVISLWTSLISPGEGREEMAGLWIPSNAQSIFAAGLDDCCVAGFKISLP